MKVGQLREDIAGFPDDAEVRIICIDPNLYDAFDVTVEIESFWSNTVDPPMVIFTGKIR